MTFTPAIPASGQTLGSSRVPIVNNFASLRNTISNGSGVPGVGQPNHADVNGIGPGKHLFVQMPVQTPGAQNLPLANEGGMITQTVAGSSELFYVRDAINTYIQMTGKSNAGNPGYTTILGGIIVQWQHIGALGGGPFQIINYPVTFPNSWLTIVGTLSNVGTPGITIDTRTNSSFRLGFAAPGSPFDWIAIGF